MNPIDETDDTEAPESAFSPLPKLNFYRPSYRSPERAEIVRDSAEIALRSQDFFSSVTLSIPFDTLKQKKESSSLDFLITFDDFSNPQNPQEPQWATLKAHPTPLRGPPQKALADALPAADTGLSGQPAASLRSRWRPPAAGRPALDLSSALGRSLHVSIARHLTWCRAGSRRQR